MSDDPTQVEETAAEISPEDASLEQLQAAIRERAEARANPLSPEVEEPEPVEEPEAEAPEEETKTEETEEPEEAETVADEPEPQEVPETPTVDSLQRLLEEERAARESDRARNELAAAKQQAHGSRLAGQIGHLKQQLTARPTTESLPESESFEGESNSLLSQVVERLGSLESRLAGKQQEQSADQARAIAAEEWSKSASDLREMPDEFKEAGAKYLDDWQEALDTDDPQTAGLLTKAVLGAISADARDLHRQKQREAAKEARVDQAATLKERKMAQSPSTASSRKVATRPKVKSPEAATVDELRAEIRRRTQA